MGLGMAAPGFGKRARHQTAIAPQRMGATEPFGVAVRCIRLIEQPVEQGLRCRRGCEQRRSLEQIARKAAAHFQSAALMICAGPLP